MVDACIFDLDGVIVDTAKFHYIAWRNMASSLGINFSEVDNENLKGVGRMESLDFILKLGDLEKTESERIKLAFVKNEHYKELIADLDQSEILPGIIAFLKLLRQEKIKIALGSSSKNARTILRALDLISYFDVIVDGTNTTISKPDPQVFQFGAKQLKIDPQKIIVFEDAIKGIEAAKSGGFYAVGVGSEESLFIADWVISGFENLTLDKIYNGLSLK